MIPPPAGPLRVGVRVTPRARRPGLLGLERDEAGRPVLRLAVAEPPADGAANAAVLLLLARLWRVPARALVLGAGAAARTKRVEVAEPAAAARVAAWLEAQCGTAEGTP